MTKNWKQWLDDHILLVLTGFLTAFIPLFPKVPLFELIPGYIVRARLEDVFIFSTVVVWGVQLLRKKVTWRTPLTVMIGAYAAVGILSTISGVVLTRTIPLELIHIAKSLLHFFRYIEYFSLFFVTYSAIKSPKDLKIFLAVAATTLLGVFIYGVGQKYLYWPVYSTMNREFSKGLRLYLTEHARVQSTFGGHYDLGAYLVIFMPILAATAFAVRRWWLRLGLWFIFAGGIWLLMLSASRTSLVAYVVSIGIVILWSSLLKRGWKAQSWSVVSRSAWIGVLTLTLLAQFGTDMYERLLQTLEAYPRVNTAYHNLNRERKDFLNVYLPTKFPLIARLRGITITVEKPENAVAFDGVLVASDQQPLPSLPPDVYTSGDRVTPVASTAAVDASASATLSAQPVYSENAFTHGLSLAIRLDTLWPRALNGFYRNPLLGTGYATLTKESTEQFTEAESTDNNFLRTLGETGGLGFITFYGAIVLSCLLAVRYLQTRQRMVATSPSFSQPLDMLFIIGFIAASIGLLINAIYIDVFAASKVALMYWMVTGVALAVMRAQPSATASATAPGQPTKRDHARQQKRKKA